MKLVLEEVGQRESCQTRKRLEGFLDVATHMFMLRPPGGGHISQWIRLIEASIACDAQAAQSRRRQRRRGADEIE